MVKERRRDFGGGESEKGLGGKRIQEKTGKTARRED
jgi:hypothetical protein